MNYVRELMVTAAKCGCIHQDVTIREAILLLERRHDGPRAGGEALEYGDLLVLNNDNLVVGKLSPTEIVINMDPIFQNQEGLEPIAHTATAGLTPALLKSLTQDMPSRCESFEQICQNVLNLTVKDCMSPPNSNECVLGSETLEGAIHKFATGNHQSLMVTSGERIVGILRLSDVFQQLAQQRRDPNSYGTKTNKLGN